MSFQHKARKRFGQNFLVDQHIINRIVRSLNASEDDNLIEIGPGQGALTKLVIDRCPSLQVIELDRDLIPMLLSQFAKYKDFKIHNQDALKFDYASLGSHSRPLRILGNLPYNISTPLMFHLLSYKGIVKDMHFMLQKEVVQRLAATPGDKLYGRLTVMMQYHCEVSHLFDVGPSSFRPQPKVDSAIVRLVPWEKPPYPADNPEHLSLLVNHAFQQRRKTLRNTLKDDLAPLAGRDLPIDTSLRAERLSISDFVNLSNFICEHEGSTKP